MDPPFAEAKEHNPLAIALLCPQCHAKVTRGFLAKQTVKEALHDPMCRKKGYASELFDIGRTHPKLVFCGATITDTLIPIQIRGIPLFQIEQAEELGGPFRLSGNFHNSRGQLSLQIIENEWHPMSSNWDVETAGGIITVRDSPGHISLRLRAAPPDGLIVEQLNMFLGGFRILGDRKDLIIESPDGRRNTFRGCIASNCRVGFAFE